MREVLYKGFDSFGWNLCVITMRKIKGGIAAPLHADAAKDVRDDFGLCAFRQLFGGRQVAAYEVVRLVWARNPPPILFCCTSFLAEYFDRGHGNSRDRITRVDYSPNDTRIHVICAIPGDRFVPSEKSSNHLFQEPGGRSNSGEDGCGVLVMLEGD